MNYFDILLAKKLEDDRDPKVEGLSVNKNGTYSEEGVVYKPVVVALPLDNKTITANGTYKASDDNLEGYDEVEVNVPLPQNCYIKKTAVNYPINPSQLPLPKAEVTFSGDRAVLYVGTDEVENDTAPYVYRQSPANKSSVDLSIVGGTVAWNQLVQNGNFADTSGWLTNNMTASVSSNIGTFTSNQSGNKAVYQNFDLIQNHIYFLWCNYKSTNDFNIQNVEGGLSKTATSTFVELKSVVKRTGASGTRGIIFYDYSDSQSWTLELKKVNLIDLTQAFGSTIADYIYSLEQATAGSGIAWLRSYGFLTKDYYAYQSGKLESVNVSSRKVVGKNLYNIETTIQGTIGSNGAVSPSTTRIVSDFIPTFKQQMSFATNNEDKIKWIVYYDFAKNYISDITVEQTSKTFVPPTNAEYIRVVMAHSDNSTIVPSDVPNAQAEFGSTATAYEPYTSTTYPLDSDLTLRGILKKDANNNLYYDGDTYASDGTVVRKYGVVDLGSLSWNRVTQSGEQIFVANLDDIKLPSSSSIMANAITTKYTLTSTNRLLTTDNMIIAIGTYLSTTSKINVKDNSYSDKDAFKSAMNGVYLVYELATPTTESATPFTNPQLVFSGGTEEFVDAGVDAQTRDVEIPVGNDSNYVNGDIYIKYGTSPIDLAKEYSITPPSTAYISSNGTEDVEYWEVATQ